MCADDVIRNICAAKWEAGPSPTAPYQAGFPLPPAHSLLASIPPLGPSGYCVRTQVGMHGVGVGINARGWGCGRSRVDRGVGRVGVRTDRNMWGQGRGAWQSSMGRGGEDR